MGDQARCSWLRFIMRIARALNDPRMYERACLAQAPEIGGAECAGIARAWLAAGERATADEWFERIPAADRLMAQRREELLAEMRAETGRHFDPQAYAWRRIRTVRSTEALRSLLGLIDVKRRDEAVALVADRIRHDVSFSAGDASILLECGRHADAAEYVVRRRPLVNGDDWERLRPLAEDFEAADELVAAAVIYRALIDSILQRAQSSIYHHAARYHRRLESLSTNIVNWGDVPPQDEYAAQLRERHARKHAFWRLIGD
jgi:hypothetical protein